MPGWAFGVLALAVAAVVTARAAWRRRQRRAAREAWERLPGHSPGSPLRGVHGPERSRLVEERTCPCGGQVRAFGSGPRHHEGRRLQAFLAECRRCGETLEFYFDEEP